MSLDVSVDCGADKEQDDQGAHDNTDDAQAREPLLVVPADGLEHRPETMVEVEPDGYEPNDVEGEDPPVTEGVEKQQVRIFSLTAGELLELHLGPEMGQVESQETEDDQTQDEHVHR